MKILALEFSSPQRSVAVVSGESIDFEVTDTGSGATRGLDLVAEALRETGLEREEIECLAVGLGPGSYTGIRAAIALVQGWQLASGSNALKLLGVSSAECVAAEVHARRTHGRVSVVIDAQREEFYLATYELDAAGCREVEALRLVALTEVRQREQAGEVLIGPEVTRWFASSRLVFPRASTLARLAEVRKDFVGGEQLVPIYLRETSFVKAPPPRKLPTQ